MTDKGSRFSTRQGERQLFTGQHNGLGDLLKTSSGIKSFIVDGQEVKFRRVVVKGRDVKTKTYVHDYNPRNQKAVTKASILSLLANIIKAEAIKEDSYALIDSEGNYGVIEGGRRRFCAIELEFDYPLLVADEKFFTKKSARNFILSSDEKKKWSFRELGTMHVEDYPGLENLGRAEKTEVADKLGVSYETLRRRLVAYSIPEKLLELFPDYEGIPNNFYARLSRIAKECSLDDLCDYVKKELGRMDMSYLDNEELIEETQLKVLSLMQSYQKPQKKPVEPEWENDVVKCGNTEFEFNKNKKKGNVEIKLPSNLNNEQLAQIKEYIKELLS